MQGLAGAGQGELIAPVSHHLIKDMVLLAEVKEVGIGEWRPARGMSGIARLYRHQAIRLSIRQRAQKYRVDNTKYCCVRPDTERQCEHGDRRETRVSSQL